MAESNFTNDVSTALSVVEAVVNTPSERLFVEAFFVVKCQGGAKIEYFSHSSARFGVRFCSPVNDSYSELLIHYSPTWASPFVFDFAVSESMHQISGTSLVDVDVDRLLSSVEQLYIDNKKTRIAASDGLSLLRFSGSELARDAHSVALETMKSAWVSYLGKLAAFGKGASFMASVCRNEYNNVLDLIARDGSKLALCGQLFDIEALSIESGALRCLDHSAASGSVGKESVR